MSASNVVASEAPCPALVGAARCMELVWPDPASRPSLRTFRTLQARRQIPYLKIGHLTYFDPAEVRRALNRKCLVKER